MINVCLSWWSKSPKTYKHWRDTVQCLPHESTLQAHKNCLTQKPGFNDKLFDWMEQEAARQGLKSYEKSGAIVLDEMSIQVRRPIINYSYCIPIILRPKSTKTIYC